MTNGIVCRRPEIDSSQNANSDWQSDLGFTPLPVPLSGRVLRMAKAAVDLSAFTWRHLFRFAERLIVVGIRSVPRSSLGKSALLHIACSAFRAVNSNTPVGLVLKNPEIHAQPPLSSPCQNDANRNKSDSPHAMAKSSNTVMASSVKPPFQTRSSHRKASQVCS